GFGSVDDRVERLRQAVRATRDRGAPIWVGGHAPAVRAVAAEEADGWNAWAADVDRFKRWAGEARAAARREPFACSWGGLAVLDATDDAARERAERLHAVPGTIVGGPETVAKTARELQD